MWFITKYIKWYKVYYILKCERASIETKVSEVAQSCPTLCNPIDYSLPGSSVHGIFQARVLEWVAIPFSRGSSQPRDWTRVFCIVGWHFTIWATREVWISHNDTHIPSLLSLPPTQPSSHPSRSSQSTRLGSLYYTATSHQLSILHMREYMYWCYFLHSSHSLLAPAV